MRRFVVAVATVVVLALAPSASAAGGLIGKYQTKFASGPLKGTMTLSFSKKGTYTAKGSFGKITGRATISASTVTFSHEKGSSCTGAGKYRFKLTRTTLKLTNLTDACGDRSGALTRTFKRVG